MAREGWHVLAEYGRFQFCWKDGGNSVKLFSTLNKQWAFVLDEDGTLADLEEIALTFDWNLSGRELRGLIEGLQCVPNWLEYAQHDLDKYGEVGVSF